MIAFEKLQLVRKMIMQLDVYYQTIFDQPIKNDKITYDNI